MQVPTRARKGRGMYTGKEESGGQVSRWLREQLEPRFHVTPDPWQALTSSGITHDGCTEADDMRLQTETQVATEDECDHWRTSRKSRWTRGFGRKRPVIMNVHIHIRLHVLPSPPSSS